jgi:thioredoxin-related protein
MYLLSTAVRTSLFILLLTSGLSVSSLASGEGWTSDFEAAKTQASKENKDLLIDFTGSDWCGWCKRLVAEVFKHDAFKEGIADSFVLVELDYPSPKVPQSDVVKAQNAELKDRYGIRGYPTIYLTDAAGRPYARTGYQQGGPKAYVAHLDQHRKQREKRDELFKQAKGQQGLEKARQLISALKLVPEESLGGFYGEEMAAIKQLDPDDTLNFVRNQESQEQFKALESKVQGTFRSGNTEPAHAWIEDFIADRKPEGELLQATLMLDVIAYAVAEKMDEALSAVNKVLEVGATGSTADRAQTMKVRILDEQRHQLLTSELEAKAFADVIAQVDLVLQDKDLDKFPRERLVILKAQALQGDGKTADAMALLDAIEEPFPPTRAKITELRGAWEKAE